MKSEQEIIETIKKLREQRPDAEARIKEAKRLDYSCLIDDSLQHRKILEEKIRVLEWVVSK